MSRWLGLDVGEKRIGVAVSDPLGITAQGIKAIERKCVKKDCMHIFSLYDEYDAQGIVVGLPKNMNNTLGFKAEEIQLFVKELLKRREVPIEWIDERLTTVSAERVLLEADVSRNKRKQVVDKLAATFILQTFLDKR